MKPATTKQEVIDRLNGLNDDYRQYAHVIAQGILLDAIRIGGMEDVVDAYLEAKKRVGF